MQFEAQLARSPAKAICHVFGRYCKQALQVARCESGYRTGAQNGQYRGLFQMGSSERQLFGHGESALDAGPRRIPLLRSFGTRLEPVVLQAVELTPSQDSCANCGPRHPPRGSHGAP